MENKFYFKSYTPTSIYGSEEKHFNTEEELVGYVDSLIEKDKEYGWSICVKGEYTKDFNARCTVLSISKNHDIWFVLGFASPVLLSLYPHFVDLVWGESEIFNLYGVKH